MRARREERVNRNILTKVDQTDASVNAGEALIPDPGSIRCRWEVSAWVVAQLLFD